jgi:hypothetical protein
MTPTFQRILAVAIVLLLLLGGVGVIVWLRGRGIDEATLPANQPSNGQSQVIQEPIADPLIPKDADGDRIPDTEEAEKGTDPNAYDTDADGWSDGEEAYDKKTDPLKKDEADPRIKASEQADAAFRAGATVVAPSAPTPSQPAPTDADNDGLTNIQEEQLGTNPTNPDTDGDGFKDGDEVKAGYNPNGPGKLSQ